MNLRKQINKNTLNNLPNWLSYYNKDLCDPCYGGIYMLDINEPAVYEIVLYKMLDNTYYMGVTASAKKVEELSIPILKIGEGISNGLFVKLNIDVDVNSEISMLINNFNNEFDTIFFYSKKESYLTIPYLFNKFCN